jgi:hypothetical protein
MKLSTFITVLSVATTAHGATRVTGFRGTKPVESDRELQSVPTLAPSESPGPSGAPTLVPSESPGPSGAPSEVPSSFPSEQPSNGGRRLQHELLLFGEDPAEYIAPTLAPSESPGPSGEPSELPSEQPSQPSDGGRRRGLLDATDVSGALILPGDAVIGADGAPSLAPSASPGPSEVPSLAPSASPQPSGGPSGAPSDAPSGDQRRLATDMLLH